MTEKEVLKFLKYEYSPPVDLAISMANLDWREETAITLCGRKGKTQSDASEEVGWSVDTMQRWYRKGMKKLCKAWDNMQWIKKLIE